MDRWQSKPVVCKGGLLLNVDAQTQGAAFPGTARILQNYEPSLDGGYERVLGYSEWDENAVTGDTDEPITGVGIAHGNVYAVRKTAGGDNAIYKSSGSGWGTALNGTSRTGTVTKARFITYVSPQSSNSEVVVQTDGNNPAWKYDGSSETALNGTSAPTDPKYAAYHLGRLVLAGYSANIEGIILSAPNNDEDYENGAIEIDIGDTVIGLRSFRDILYIFCENSIHKLLGDNTANFITKPVTTSIGCISGDSIQEVGGDLIFFAPDGLRSLAATEKINDVDLGLVSQPINSVLNDYTSGFNDYNFNGVVVREKSQYRLMINDSNITMDDDAISYLGKLNEEAKYEWATLKGFRAYSTASRYEGTTEIVVFGHPTDGMVYRMESGNSRNGSNIEYIYRTPAMTFDDVAVRKVMHKIELYTQISGDVDLNLALRLDFAASDIPQPGPIPIIRDGNVASYGSAIYDTDSYSTVSFPVFKKLLNGAGFVIAFEFTGSDVDPTHRIDSFNIEFAYKGRR